MAIQEIPPEISPVDGSIVTHVEPAQTTSSRSNNFNLLRLLFAALVLLSHAPEITDNDGRREPLHLLFNTLSFGDVAVDGFFLLSGCLIVQSWQRTPELLDFLKKRALRIYPGFVVAALVSALIVGPLAAVPAYYFGHFDLLQFLKSVLLLRQPTVPPVFAGMYYPEINGSMWTIAYEFRCYLLVAAWGICGLFRRKWLWLTLTVVFVLLLLAPGFVSRVRFPGESLLQQFYLIDDPGLTVRLTAFFGVGGCFALFRERTAFKPLWALLAAGALCACLFNYKIAPFGAATFGAYLLFWFAEVQSPLLARFRRLPDISYGVYLYGWPVEKLQVWFFPGISPWLVFGLACVLCTGLGLASWFGVERPFLRLKPKKSVPVPDAALSPAP